MKKATAKMIESVEKNFNEFKSLGHSTLKAAYMATSGRGFVEIKKSFKEHLILYRPEDRYFICLSTPEVEIEKILIVKEKIAKFHTDTEIFNR
jgi:hypothetical protein